MIPLDEVARISSSEPNLDQPQDLNIFKKSSEVDDDLNMCMIPGASNIIRIETIPGGFNSARAYHLKVILPTLPRDAKILWLRANLMTLADQI